VAKASRIENREIEISPKDFRDVFDLLIYHLDEPRMGMGSFSQFIMAREVAKERKVILAGHGGDELFAGYPLFKAFWAMEEGISATSVRELSKMRGPELPMVADALISRVFAGKLKFAPKLYSSLVEKTVEASRWLPAFERPPGGSPLRMLNDYYLKVYLPGLLVVEDRISMAHGLETRVPFLDLDLANFAFQCPIHKKIREGKLKAWLKLAAEKVLPAELMTAPKRGFPTPLRLWFRDELKDFCFERLVGGGETLNNLVPRSRREKLLKWHCETPLPFAFDERRAHQIWMLLSLESWTRQFKLTL
jgi:asparagine synthase (glutamine-hydrolysing)